jgi:hypothetical protein
VEADRERLWTQLADLDPGVAYAARRAWFERGADVAWLAERLHPAIAPSTQAIDGLVARLGHAAFDEREAAHEQLATWIAAARGRLASALDRTEDIEVRGRVEELLARPPLPLLLGCRDGQLLRALRMVDALGWIDEPAARALLERLAGGALGHPLTLAARRALERRGAVFGSALAEPIGSPDGEAKER